MPVTLKFYLIPLGSQRSNSIPDADQTVQTRLAGVVTLHPAQDVRARRLILHVSQQSLGKKRMAGVIHPSPLQIYYNHA